MCIGCMHIFHHLYKETEYSTGFGNTGILELIPWGYQGTNILPNSLFTITLCKRDHCTFILQFLHILLSTERLRHQSKSQWSDNRQELSQCHSKTQPLTLCAKCTVLGCSHASFKKYGEKPIRAQKSPKTSDRASVYDLSGVTLPALQQSLPQDK
jgi:hypothetical protein